MKKYNPWFLKQAICFILGAGIITSFPPIYFIIFAPISIAVLSYIFLYSTNLRKALLAGFFSGIGLGAVGFYWFYYPIVFATSSKPLGIIVVVVAALIISLFMMLIAAFSYYTPKRNFWLLIIFNTAIWSGVEVIKGQFLFGGMPWNVIATIWDADIYMLQMASVVGMYGLGFITYFLCGCLFVLITRNSYLHKVISLLIMIIMLVGCHWYGYYRVTAYQKLPLTDKEIAVIQPNVKQIDKIEGHNESTLIANLINITNALTKANPNLLVVWPETVISGRVMLNGDYIVQTLLNTLNNKATLVAGMLRTDDDNKLYNSALVLNNAYNFIGYYDKIHLVPFGEYIPGVSLFSLDSTFVSNFSFSRGKRSIPFKVGKLPLFKILICFEAIFSNHKLNSKNVNFLVNIANDGWYGNSVEPYQHLALVKFRAIEGGVPVIRASNSGISAIIDSVGMIRRYLPMFAGGYIISKTPKVFNKFNIFAITGNNIIFMVDGVLLIILLYFMVRRISANVNQRPKESDRY